VVAKDISKVVENGGELGLSLNMSKCELISHDGFTVTDSLLQSFPSRACLDQLLIAIRSPAIIIIIIIIMFIKQS